MKKPNKKLIIALTGHPSSGKGEVAKYLGKKYHAHLFRFSAILKDMLNRLYLDADRKNNIIMSACLRKNFGEDILAKVIAEDIKKVKSGIIIVDGVRRYADVKYLKHAKNFYLIGIKADPKIRYQRQLLRKEKPDDAKKTFKQFLKDQMSASDRDVADLIKHANMEIDNNGDRKNLYKQIDKIITQL